MSAAPRGLTRNEIVAPRRTRKRLTFRAIFTVRGRSNQLSTMTT